MGRRCEGLVDTCRIWWDIWGFLWKGMSLPLRVGPQAPNWGRQPPGGLGMPLACWGRQPPPPGTPLACSEAWHDSCSWGRQTTPAGTELAAGVSGPLARVLPL